VATPSFEPIRGKWYGVRDSDPTLTPNDEGAWWYRSDLEVFCLWDGSTVHYGVPPEAHAPTHETGGSDALSALDTGVITTGIFNVARLPVRAGIARGSSITLPVQVCMWLAWDVVAGAFISSKVLPWWNQRGTTLDISNASQNATAGDIVSSFAVANGPGGLTWDGANLWVCDVIVDTVLKVTTTGTIVSSFAAPDGSPYGLTWDGGSLWNSDYSTDKIYELTTTGTIVSSFASPDAQPIGLAWDGESLWNADFYIPHKVFELTPTGTIVSSFTSPDTSPTGLTWDGVNLWHCDNGADKVYELTTTGTIVSSFASPDASPNGLTWDGENLWNADSNVNKVFEIKDGKRNVRYIVVGR